MTNSLNDKRTFTKTSIPVSVLTLIKLKVITDFFLPLLVVLSKPID